MTFPDINVNAIVLTLIALFIVANVLILACARHIKQRNEDWDRALDEHMRGGGDDA